MKTDIKYTVYADGVAVETFTNIESAKRLRDELELRRTGRTTNMLNSVKGLIMSGDKYDIVVRVAYPSMRPVIERLFRDIMNLPRDSKEPTINNCKVIFASKYEEIKPKLRSNTQVVEFYDHTYWETND